MPTMLQLFIHKMEPARKLYTREILDFAKNYDFLGKMTQDVWPSMDTQEYIFYFEIWDAISEEIRDETLTELYDHMNEFCEEKGIEEFASNAIIAYEGDVLNRYPFRLVLKD